MTGKGACVAGEREWQGGMHGVTCMAEGAWQGGMGSGGCVAGGHAW